MQGCAYGFVQLFPNTNRFVIGARNNKISVMTERQGPYFAMVPFKVLYVLKLNQN